MTPVARSGARRLRWFVGRAIDAAAWRRGHMHLLLRQLRADGALPTSGATDTAHLTAAAAWLERAQDAVGGGGFSGRYRLDRGWTAAYPETTGYLIPTLLALANHSGVSQYRLRAAGAVRFLLPLQLPSGAFSAGELDEKSGPSVFNTAQIIKGLDAWSAASGDAAALDAAHRAARWLVSVQDSDGAWRRYTFGGKASAYYAYASCALATLGKRTRDNELLAVAERHLNWVLSQYDHDRAWFRLAGFPDDHAADRAVTHTIGYTLDGVLESSQALGREDALAAARASAIALAEKVRALGSVPGVLSAGWRPDASYACLTGNAQMALVWLRLNTLEPNHRLTEAALIAIEQIKAAQSLTNPNPGIRGGIAGSYPIWGDYLYMAFPNWAAKYFVDALLAWDAAAALP